MRFLERQNLGVEGVVDFVGNAKGVSKDYRLSPSIVSLVVCPVLKIGIIIKLRPRSVELQPVSAVFIEPAVQYFDIALALIIAVVIEPLLDFLLSLFGHSEVICAVKLEVIPLVIFS